MGFPSYKEDIERAREDLEHLRRQLDDPNPKGDPEAHLRALRDACDRIAARFDDLLDLATDPHLQLANEIVALRKDQNDLKSALGSSRASHAQEVARLKRSYAALEASHALAKRQADAEAADKRKDLLRLNEAMAELQRTLEFERAGRADFGAMIEKYPPRSLGK